MQTFTQTLIRILLIPIFFYGGVAMAQEKLGGLSPAQALEYMKATPNIVIVEVNTDYWKIKNGFKGALHIPHTEIAQRYDEIPKNRPVILHCGLGEVSVPAYETLLQKRPDIPEISYIKGAPPIQAYNEWLEKGAK